MSKYVCALQAPEEDSTEASFSISVGEDLFELSLQWAVATEEQYGIIRNYFKRKASSDPVVITSKGNTTFQRDYDYYAFYSSLSGLTDTELTNWLNTTTALPESLKNNNDLNNRLNLLHIRTKECEDLKEAVELYQDIVKWQFVAVFQDKQYTGFVVPGGWYNHQGDDVSFRFTSSLEDIGQNDLGNVSIEIEVSDDE